MGGEEEAFTGRGCVCVLGWGMEVSRLQCGNLNNPEYAAEGEKHSNKAANDLFGGWLSGRTEHHSPHLRTLGERGEVLQLV